ncbi:MAG: hypothetical protein COB04_06980 [Gammaproteobacteria bacterium]|nr:MAG: hypothetical protein COB04_06980 [Gammaproteobacteria bacterium]
MTNKKRKYFSDEAVITWVVYSAISVFGLSFLVSAVVFALYDCWLMTSKYYVVQRNCAPGLNVNFVLPIPVILGTIIGTVFTFRSLEKG